MPRPLLCEGLFFLTLIARRFLNLVGDVVENVVNHAGAVDHKIYPVLRVVVAEGRGPVMIDVEALFDCVEIVVGAACLFPSVEHPFHEFLLRHFKSDHGMEVGAAFAQQFLEASACGMVRGKPSKMTPSFPSAFFSSTSSRMLIIRSSGIS